MIPFGLKNGRFYDVSEVDRGRACGCVCPSCGKNLIARKGTSGTREHCFAHDRVAKANDTETEHCQYSFSVVARLVIKQTLQEMAAFSLLLPDFVITESRDDQYGRTCSESIYVTTEKTLTIDDYVVEPDAVVDVLCDVKGHRLAIHFSYEGRPKLNVDALNWDPSLSLLAIALDPLRAEYDAMKAGGTEIFKNLLMEYVFVSGPREWWNHERLSRQQQQLSVQLSRKVEKNNTVPFFAKPEETVSRLTQLSHQGQKSEAPMCIQCKEALAGYLDDQLCQGCLNTYLQLGYSDYREVRQALKTRSQR